MFEGLDPRVMLDATPTATMPVGAATIFTQLPPVPEGATQAFVTPSDQPVIISNIVGATADADTPPDVARQPCGLRAGRLEPDLEFGVYP